MFARVTQFEIDTLRIDLDDALDRFRQLILPAVRGQAGYLGVSVMRNREGQGLLISFWDSEASARAGVESNFYAEQLGKFLTFYKQPPNREDYEVVFTEMAAAVPGS
jgi:heme-degrading monooxygenase HmoA